MTPDEQPGEVEPRVRFLAAAAALRAIDTAVAAARHDAADRTRPDRADAVPDAAPDTHDALAALVLLRELRARLATWEPDLIEDARQAGASWAALAGPLGVASRQAAERRYLRLRPGGVPGTTGDQRVQATRDHRAADRAVAAWAREHAGALRALAGQITALDDLSPQAEQPQAALAAALGHDDPARLLAPLATTRPHLDPDHPDLGTRIDAFAHQVDRLRQASDHQRRRAT
ncbi:type III effector protein [Yinghuangia soli]|uniref:Type III effector protein n=1 Tax=Yinghuangia soli TaxID=2908204 RepID=A0AA41PWK1_9ACTN|nr:type III effector protein [Yinghuangia soli]MCF2527149.1 type III effector protein [Yinghuangia soli]